MATRTLNVVVAGDVKGLGRAMGQAERDIGRLQRSTKGAGKDTAAFASVTSSGFSRVGVAARGMAFAGAGGAALLAKSFVTAASDIQESLSKNQVLFGSYARQVERFSQTSAVSFGISRKAALEYTGVFGNLFRALGQSRESSAQFSVRLTKLAADMASFNNTSIEDALEAIRSGLVGETEPLRRFGVNMNDATLRAQALRLGLVKTTKEALSPQTRALAAQSLIIRQTSNAHGDFQKTQGGLANQTRILKARTSDFSAELGKVLTPAVTRALRAVNRFAGEMREGSGEGGRFARNMRDVVQVLGVVARAFILAGKAIIVAVKATERFIRTGRLIGEAIGGSINAVGKMGGRLGAELIRGIVRGIGNAGGAVKDALKDAVGSVGGFLGIGEGIGKEIGGKFGAMPRGGSISGSLMGAKPGMRPVAVMGQRFGLAVSSGLRPGAVTSSGNPSWHGTGEALDVSGPASGMMGFAKMMRSRFGSRLAELIYTPMGLGISNGRPHRFTGQVAKDHYDHVHVAMDLGRPGQGDGPGRSNYSPIGVAAAAARAAGFKGNDLVTALAIAGAESGYNKNAQNLVHPDHSIGLWQINQLAHKGKYGSDAELKDPVKNARAAWAVSGGGKNWRPWSVYTKGTYRAYIARARSAALESRGQGAADARPNARGGKAAKEPVFPFRGGGIGQAISGGLARNTPEQLAANADVAVAQAEASGNPIVQIAALSGQRRLKEARIRKIQRALRKRLRPATRLRLTQELSGLVGEVAAIGGSIKELKQPAEGTGLAAMEGWNEAVAAATPSTDDFLNRDIANAALTPGTADDLAAATAARDFAAQQYAFSRGGDPRTETEFAQKLKAAQDAVDSLTEATKSQEEAMREHTEALKGVKDELKRQTDFAAAVQTTEAFQLKKYLADLLSGQIGGYGHARAMTPGAGKEFAW